MIVRSPDTSLLTYKRKADEFESDAGSARFDGCCEGLEHAEKTAVMRQIEKVQARRRADFLNESFSFEGKACRGCSLRSNGDLLLLRAQSFMPGLDHVVTRWKIANREGTILT